MIWRLIFLAVMLVFVGIRARFRRVWASIPRQGTRPLRERVLTTLVVLGQSVPALLWLGGDALSAAQLPLPEPLRALGALLCALSLGLLWWIHSALGAHFSPRLELWEGHALIQSGPYRWVRHPMYSAGFVQILGYGLLTANLVVFVAPLVALTLLVALRLPDEERMLEERFGEDWRRWRDRTGRLIPRLPRG